MVMKNQRRKITEFKKAQDLIEREQIVMIFGLIERGTDREAMMGPMEELCKEDGLVKEEIPVIELRKLREEQR